MTTDPNAIYAYHQRTKHQVNAYAKGPESLDWDDQPNPFRRFSGCEIITLPRPGIALPWLFADLDHPENIPAQALTLSNIGILLELSLGLSAWKQFGPDRWALRCNPSSGNLHPTEAYVLCSNPNILAPGVYHYVSHDHHLEKRCQFNSATDSNEVYIGLSSLHWREAWKYGERAFRYCQHDVGHALAALSYAAACLGWSLELCNEISDVDLASWLGVDRETDFVVAEHEAGDILLRLHAVPPITTMPATDLSHLVQNAEWTGTATKLSARHFYRWPIIDEISSQAQKPTTPIARWQASGFALPLPSHNLPASQIIRQRRSAQHFNAKAKPLPQDDFYRMLAALLPNNKPPFTTWNGSPEVHLFLFIHQVEGLEPGLYFLPRSTEDLPELQQALSAEFIWQAIQAPFSLFLLTLGNLKQAAKTLSCHQAIASDGMFSLGMLSRFADNINAEPWRYRRLFWECGLLGQILYLEAEAAGVRGTGIGCFFDDAVHGMLGLQDNTWQSLYHFTVGEPMEDARLQTFAAYEHLNAL